MASLFLSCLLAAATVQATGMPTHNLPHILDPLNDTGSLAHGIIVSPERMVMKLDCAECPKYDRHWNSEGTALIYDFAIASHYSTSRFNDGSHSNPSITLNHNSFYSSDPSQDPFPATAGSSWPVPADTSIASYLWRPGQYTKADLVTTVTPYPVPNTHGWNITSIVLLTLAYGKDDNKFENHWGNLSAIEIFLQRKTVSTHHYQDSSQIELRDVNVKEEWTLEWWQIVPVDILGKKEGFNEDGTAFKVPKGLEDKLLGKMPKQSRLQTQPQSRSPCKGHKRIGPWNALQVWTLAAAVVSAFAGMAYVTTWVVKAVKKATVESCIDYLSEKERGGLINLDEYAFLNEETGDYIHKVGIALE